MKLKKYKSKHNIVALKASCTNSFGERFQMSIKRRIKHRENWTLVTEALTYCAKF